MNILPTYTSVAFFLLAKAPAERGTKVDAEVVKERLQLLLKPKTAVTFDEQTPAQEVKGFYQCMALFEGCDHVRNAWAHYEQLWLSHKLHSYWAHLRSICKAEDVSLMQKGMIKFPWSRGHYEYGVASHIADHVFNRFFYVNEEAIQQRISNYQVDDATRAAVLQWMHDQGRINIKKHSSRIIKFKNQIHNT